MLTYEQVEFAAGSLVEKHFRGAVAGMRVWGVPRGGVPAAYAFLKALEVIGRPGRMVDSPEDADVIVDDIIDSGQTAKRILEQYGTGRFFVALFTKPNAPWAAFGVKVGYHLKDDAWVSFPWEANEAVEGTEDIFTRLLQYIGEDSTRGGLAETPKRAAKAWAEWTAGYNKDPAKVLKVFEDGGEKYDQMVCVRDIPVYSHCEHHLAPIFGVAHVAYVPNGKIVGLSKINRVVEIYARRLQVQERLTHQIAEALEQHLRPRGAAVMLECRHFCIESRGIQHQGSLTVTTALKGLFRDDPSAKEEFFMNVGRTSC